MSSSSEGSPVWRSRRPSRSWSLRDIRFSVRRARRLVGVVLNLRDGALDEEGLDAVLPEGGRQLVVDAPIVRQRLELAPLAGRPRPQLVALGHLPLQDALLDQVALALPVQGAVTGLRGAQPRLQAGEGIQLLLQPRQVLPRLGYLAQTALQDLPVRLQGLQLRWERPGRPPPASGAGRRRASTPPPAAGRRRGAPRRIPGRRSGRPGPPGRRGARGRRPPPPRYAPSS